MGTGIWFIVIGLIVWGLNLGVFSFWKWSRDWPLIFVLIGIYLVCESIAKRLKRKKPDKRKVKEVIKKLEKGEISPDEAIDELKE